MRERKIKKEAFASLTLDPHLDPPPPPLYPQQGWPRRTTTPSSSASIGGDDDPKDCLNPVVPTDPAHETLSRLPGLQTIYWQRERSRGVRTTPTDPADEILSPHSRDCRRFSDGGRKTRGVKTLPTNPADDILSSLLAPGVADDLVTERGCGDASRVPSDDRGRWKGGFIGIVTLFLFYFFLSI